MELDKGTGWNQLSSFKKGHKQVSKVSHKHLNVYPSMIQSSESKNMPNSHTTSLKGSKPNQKALSLSTFEEISDEPLPLRQENKKQSVNEEESSAAELVNTEAWHPLRKPRERKDPHLPQRAKPFTHHSSFNIRTALKVPRDWSASEAKLDNQEDPDSVLQQYGHLFKSSLVKPIYKPLINTHKVLQGKCRAKDFVPLAKLGKGGFGMVFRALHQPTNQEFAVKYIKPEGVQKNKIALKNEEEITHKLYNKRIVQYYCSSKASDGGLLMVQELCHGQDLKRAFTSNDTKILQKPVNIAWIVMQLLQGLYYLHSEGIFHRDIKPHNIVIDNQLFIKIIDFGLSLRDRNNQVEKRAGTLRYFAPEQMSRKKHGRAVDLNSLGIMIYFFLTGKYPYEEVTWAKLDDIGKRLKDGTLQVPEIPGRPEATELIRKLTIVDPEKRWHAVYGNSEELGQLELRKDLFEMDFFAPLHQLQ